MCWLFALKCGACIVYIYFYFLAVIFFFPCCHTAALFVPLCSFACQWNNVKPLAGQCITSPCVHRVPLSLTRVQLWHHPLPSVRICFVWIRETKPCNTTLKNSKNELMLQFCHPDTNCKTSVTSLSSFTQHYTSQFTSHSTFPWCWTPILTLDLTQKLI